MASETETEVSKVSTPDVADRVTEVVTLTDDEGDITTMSTTKTSLTLAQQGQAQDANSSKEGAEMANITSMQNAGCPPTTCEDTPSSPVTNTSSRSSSQSRPGSSPSNNDFQRKENPPGAQTYHIKIGPKIPSNLPSSDVFTKVGGAKNDKVRYDLFVSKRQEEIQFLKRKLEATAEDAKQANQQLTEALTKTIADKMGTLSETLSSANTQDIAKLKEHFTSELAGFKTSMIQNHKYTMIEIDFMRRSFEEGQNEVRKLVAGLTKGNAGAVEGVTKNSTKLKVSQVKKNVFPKRGRPKKQVIELELIPTSDESSDDFTDDVPAPKQGVSRYGANKSPQGGTSSANSSSHSQRKRSRRY